MECEIQIRYEVVGNLKNGETSSVRAFSELSSTTIDV